MNPVVIRLTTERSCVVGAAAPPVRDALSGANGPAVEGLQAYREAQIPEVFLPPSPAWAVGDAAVLAVLLGTATAIVIKRKPRRWLLVHLGLAFLYFGLFRGGCLCPVGATSNVAIGIVRPELVGRVELAIFLLPLVAALVAGRVFCGAVCPLGAVQEFATSPRARPLHGSLHAVLRALPVVVLGLTVVSAVSGLVFLACRLDPYKLVFFSGHLAVQNLGSVLTARPLDLAPWYVGDAVAWLTLALLLLCGWVVPRIFCRYLCPYGVLLGVLSCVAWIRRTRPAVDCDGCQRCVRRCPAQAIRIGDDGRARVSNFACVQCGRCADVCTSRRTRPAQLVEQASRPDQC